MKQLKLLTIMLLISSFLPVTAQELNVDTNNDGPEVIDSAYYGLNRDYVDFTSEEKKFNDWSLGLYFGMPIVQGADLNTILDGDVLWSYDAQAVLTKQITHAFGLALQGNYGRTEQQARKGNGTFYRGHTNYWAPSLLADINLSGLFRRIDNRSRYAWAMHLYGGIGSLFYDANIRKETPNGVSTDFVKTAEPGGFGSIFIQGGTGIRYKINQKLDFETKFMYLFTGDEEWDGSGAEGQVFNDGIEIDDFEEGKDDGVFTASLGLIYKIGGHPEHLVWVDPLAIILPNSGESLQNALTVCAEGDKDDDGVCDDWDRELNTPIGARVDGAGRALDTDLDGVIDLYDECVVLPGPADNKGCPLNKDSEALINMAIANLEFSLDSDVISPSYYPLLDNAAAYLKHYNDNTWNVIGHTDSRASQEYNLDLSRRRAEAVKSYLVEKHDVDPNTLNVVAMGENDLRFPECVPATVCPEWKNHANRRVIFVQNQ